MSFDPIWVLGPCLKSLAYDKYACGLKPVQSLLLEPKSV